MNVKQLFDLQGRVALVTGGSRGLGLQMAEALGEMGARLALTARKKNELDEAVATQPARGKGVWALASLDTARNPVTAATNTNTCFIVLLPRVEVL